MPPGTPAAFEAAYGTTWLVELLEQGRWIGTGFYARVRVTRVNDGIVRLRVRPLAQPGRFFTVCISQFCLPGRAGCR